MENRNNMDTHLDARSFLGGYLKKEDLSGPQIARLVDVYATVLEGEKRPKLVARFDGVAKTLVINSTNNRRLAEIFGTNDANQWRGEVTLYVDESIEYGGRVVGGIRVRPARRNGAAVRQEQVSRMQQQAPVAEQSYNEDDWSFNA